MGLDMRIPRSLQLYREEGLIHHFWRCHNRSFLLKGDENKNLYFRSIIRAIKRLKTVDTGEVEIHAYCCMENHFHSLIRYRKGWESFSKFIHRCHTIFGIRFNQAKNRSGKIAEDRPKTSVLENEKTEMAVHFYIEANPIRAGIDNLNSLRFNKFCSYGYFAFGVQNEYTTMITVPSWYTELADKSLDRQAIYRTMFSQYLSQNTDGSGEVTDFEDNLDNRPARRLSQTKRIDSKMIKVNSAGLFALFIGSSDWIQKEKESLLGRMKRIVVLSVADPPG